MTGPDTSRTRQVQGWVEAHVRRVEPVETAANHAAWEAATTGSEEALRRSADARAALKRLYSDPDEAAVVRAFVSEGVADPKLRRELQLLDLRYRENQLSPETIDDLTRRESELEQVFYTFRPAFEGSPASNNDLLDVLRHETDSDRRRAAWEAAKRIGAEVAGPLRDLVRRRNLAARSLGYTNFYSMHLELDEIEETDLFAVLDEFRERSDRAFAELRAEMDRRLARRFETAPDELFPWHWEDFFSQEAPGLARVDLDAFFAGRDLEAIARAYFDRIGLPIDDVLARSDLYERPGKDQHAFCTDLDRRGDVRVLCNLRENERWMGTLLHELGHAAYDKFIPSTLPYLLRRPGHTLLTEAVAMLMGRLTRDPEWLRSAVGVELSEDDAADVRSQLSTSMMVSARWILVMAYFERELYRDPDRPDLNHLWWDLVESIQLVRRPEGRDQPDWASKLHLSLAPVYYHNYLLGEFTASQFATAIGESGGAHSTLADPRNAGDFLLHQVFSRGASIHWNSLIREATGARLSSRYFLADFVSPEAARR